MEDIYVDTFRSTQKRPWPFEDDQQQNNTREYTPAAPIEPPWLLGSVSELCLFARFMNIIANFLLIIAVRTLLMPNEGTIPPVLFDSNGPQITFEVTLVGEYFELIYSGQRIARLNKSFCRQVRQVVQIGVYFRAYLLRSKWEPLFAGHMNRPSATAVTIFAVDVNVYSNRHHADQVGDILAHAGLFLQDPEYNAVGASYHNPQKLQIEGIEERQEIASSSSNNQPTMAVRSGMAVDYDPAEQECQIHAIDLVESILNSSSLSHNSILQEISTDQHRIKTVLLPSAQNLLLPFHY